MGFEHVSSITSVGCLTEAVGWMTCFKGCVFLYLFLYILDTISTLKSWYACFHSSYGVIVDSVH